MQKNGMSIPIKKLIKYPQIKIIILSVFILHTTAIFILHSVPTSALTFAPPPISLVYIISPIVCIVCPAKYAPSYMSLDPY